MGRGADLFVSEFNLVGLGLRGMQVGQGRGWRRGGHGRGRQITVELGYPPSLSPSLSPLLQVLGVHVVWGSEGLAAGGAGLVGAGASTTFLGARMTMGRGRGRAVYSVPIPPRI